jgi:hypothetical protein
MRIASVSVTTLVALLATVALLARGDAVAGPRTATMHTHECPCWLAEDVAAQTQLCSCGLAGHTAVLYGQQCSNSSTSDGVDGGRGAPVAPSGGGGPLIAPAPKAPTVGKIKSAVRLDCARYPTARGC